MIKQFLCKLIMFPVFLILFVCSYVTYLFMPEHKYIGIVIKFNGE